MAPYHAHPRWSRGIIFSLLLLSLALPVQPGVAQSRCSIVPSALGGLVYDANGNGVADRDGDNWVISEEGEATGSLVAFTRTTTGPTAYLYHAAARQQLNPCAIDPSSANTWRLRVVARNGAWFLPNGKPNWNIDVRLQGLFTFRDDEFDIVLIDNTRDRPSWWTADLPDSINIATWDLDNDGVPDVEHDDMNVSGPYPLVIANRDPTWQPKPGAILPALGPLAVLSSDASDIERLHHLIPLRRLENGFSLVFTNKPAQGRPVYATENPFAFYDLHGDSDGESELKLRAVTEDIDQRGSGLTTYNEFRYSWAQTSNSQQYRLYVIGSNLNSEVTRYPNDLSVSHIDYADLPKYVLNNPWLGAAFAEDEQAGSRSLAEGIYENLLYTPALRASLLSFRENRLPPYLPIFRGLREEYNFTDYDRRPMLSFNPIDQRLHLLDAREGLIIYEASSEEASTQSFDFSDRDLATGQLDIQRAVRYSDSNADGLIDTWRLIRDSKPDDSLYVRGSTALLVNSAGVQIKYLDPQLKLNAWQQQPPTNPSEWEELNKRLLPIKRRPLDDLSAIFADLPGTPIVLPDVQLNSVSPSNARLVAQIGFLTPQAELPATLATDVGTPVPAGDYSLVRDDDQLRLSLPAPPLLELEPLRLSLPPDQIREPYAGLLNLTARNKGTQDARAEVQVAQHSGDGVTTLYSSTQVIAALDTIILNIPWSPTSSGQQTIKATLRYEGAQNGALQSVAVELPISGTAPEAALNALYASPERLAVLGLIGALTLALVIAGLFGFIRTIGNEHADQP